MFVNPFQPLVPTEETIPLTDMDYKIADPVVEFNLLEIHNWCFDKFLDKYEMPIWETNLPKYVVPFWLRPCEIMSKTLCTKSGSSC